MHPRYVTSSGAGRGASVIGALSLILLTYCGQSDEVAARTDDAQVQSFSLYTHCGIDELRVTAILRARGRASRRWQRESSQGLGQPVPSRPLSASGNAVVFTDERGHREQFGLRADATDYKHICS